MSADIEIVRAALLQGEADAKERDEAKKELAEIKAKRTTPRKQTRVKLMQLDAVQRELAEIKGRAEEIRKRYANRQFGIGYANVANDIDFIIKGEGK